MSTVYIINKGAHNFEEAEEWGTIKFLTEGRINRYNLVDMHRKLSEKLKHSKPSDYVVPCSLNALNIVACGILINKHKVLNLLLYKKGRFEDGRKGKGIYLERNLVF